MSLHLNSCPGRSLGAVQPWGNMVIFQLATWVFGRVGSFLCWKTTVGAIFSFAWDMKRGCVASQILILDVKNHGTKMPSISAKQDDEMRTWLGWTWDRAMVTSCDQGHSHIDTDMFSRCYVCLRDVQNRKQKLHSLRIATMNEAHLQLFGPQMS